MRCEMSGLEVKMWLVREEREEQRESVIRSKRSEMECKAVRMKTDRDEVSM